MSTASHLFATLIVALLIATPIIPLVANDAAPATASVIPPETITAEFERIKVKIKAKLLNNQKTEAELAPEIAEIDALLGQHAAEKTDEVATIAFAKAQIYHEVFGQTTKAITLMREISVNFPQTETAKNIAHAFEQYDAAEKLLAVGQPFPAFAETDLNGKPLVLADYKGKTVLIVFWATWCVHSTNALPHLIAAYDKYHAKGFEIIGISHDTDHAKLTSFLQEHKIAWPQYFDGLGARNKLSTRLNIRDSPVLILVDGQGKIIAKSLPSPVLDDLLAELYK